MREANRIGNGLGSEAVHLGGVVPKSHLTLSGPSQRSRPAPIPCPKETVVVAVIDDGIAFANDLFCDGMTSSRVHLAYLMSESPDGGRGHGGDPEPHGRSLGKRAIDQLLSHFTYLGLTDEDALYAKAGAIDLSGDVFSPVALRRSHGTHVAALAAGYPMSTAPKTRPLLCAALPSRVTGDTTGANLYPSLVLALKRLEQEARRFVLPDGHPAPTVFNFSYGTLDGPHDGSGLIPRLIERTVNPNDGPIRRMVLPAGNANLTRTHAVAEFGKSHLVTLDLSVLPDDRTASYVEMWMPEKGKSSTHYVAVRVTPPWGPQSPWVVAGSDRQLSLHGRDGGEIGRLSCARPSGNLDRGSIVLSINRTASLTPGEPLAPAGDWRIEIEKRAIAAGEAVEIWVRRDDSLPGYPPNGRQSHFNNPDYQLFDRYGAPLAVDPPGTRCPVRRAGTLNGLATGDAPLVIAGFTESSRRLSDYSAAGPVASRHGPDAAACSDDSPVLHGVLSAGSRSGSLVRLAGTSVAAPRIARFAAEGIARGAAGDRAWLHKEAGRHGPKLGDPTRAGAGGVDVPVDLGLPKS